MVDYHPGLGGPAQPAPELHATWALSPHDGEQYAGVLSYQPDKARFEKGGQPAEWICGHDHPGRREAVACAREELARRRQRVEYGLSNGITEMDLALVPASGLPSLPSSGASNDKICTRPSYDYPGDTDLIFARGSSEARVRVTPADRPKLFAAVGGLAPALAVLRERAGEMARQDTPALGFEARVAHVAAVQALVDAAHAAGYRLCDEDYRATAQSAGYVRDFLAGLLENGEGLPSADVEAIERVRALLER